MITAFKPLQIPAASAKPSDASFRMRVVPGTQVPADTMPVAASPSTAISPQLQNAHPVQAQPCDHDSADSKPRVMLKREGDRIVQIQIICGCGRLIELDCLYS